MNPLLSKLRHHVTGAIERGEAESIVEHPAPHVRVAECVAYIAKNPNGQFPKGWIDEVKAEARTLGILPAEKPVIGQCCRVGIDRGIEYGGDKLEVF